LKTRAGSSEYDQRKKENQRENSREFREQRLGIRKPADG
jgi:hypothetical protein